ncbi:MAG: rRNA pseudouridine synthase [Pseudomonadota bacterium]
MPETVRLAKRLAHMLPCSRREAELYITGGWVRVDGVPVDEPQYRVGDEQTVELDPQARAEPQEPVTLLLHQAADSNEAEAARQMTPETHVADDPTPRRVLRSHFARLTAVLPLQEGASGLAVFTQDRRVVRRLGDAERPVEQEYVVEVAGTIAPDGLELLQHGLQFAGRALPAIKVSWQSENRLRFALKNPQPGQLRFMCGQVGLQVVAMKRIRIGRLPMAELPPGQWRYLGERERF